MTDFLRKYQFKIFIGGIASAGFSSCTGLSAGSNYGIYREAGALAPITLFEGFNFKPIVLTKGMTKTDSEMYWWWEIASRMTTPANLMFSRNLLIYEYAPSSKFSSTSYIIYGARVMNVDFGALNAEDEGETIVTQRIELVHRGISRIPSVGEII